MVDLNEAINSAISEAKGELALETTPETTTAETQPETKPETQPAETKPETEPAKPETKPDAKPEAPTPDDEEFYNPTAEELALIEQNPALKKAYRALRKGFTQKTSELATMRKELQEKASVAEWIQNNPELAARRLAEMTGLPISEARKEVAKTDETKVVDQLESMWAERVGPETAVLLRPLFEQTARTVAEQVLQPFRQQTEQLTLAAQQRGIAAVTREFGASVIERGDEWTEEIQNEMAKLSETVVPGERTPINEYLATLYDTVITRRNRTKQVKSNLDRLKRIRSEAEPVTPSRPAPTAEERITTDMNDNDAVALAVKQARAAFSR